MLLRLKVKNFLSFYEETEFNMFPNPKRTTLSDHIYADMEVPLLKQAAIYGPNAAGKSNLLKAASFIVDFARKQNFLTDKIDTTDIVCHKFLLVKENTEPIFISIEFENEGKYFLYEIELDDESVKKEALYISGIGKEENRPLFIRELNEIKSGVELNETLKKAIDKLLSDNSLSSILSLNKKFPVIDNEDVEIAYKWFDNRIQVLSINRNLPNLFSLLAKDQKKLLEFTKEISSKIDIGIKSLQVEEEDVLDMISKEKDAALENFLNKTFKDKNTDGVSFGKDGKLDLSIEREGETFIARRLLFEQYGIDGFVGKLSLGDQSDGTIRLLMLIPALYSLINENCVYFIDEIEHSIHPSLIYKLLEYYSKTKTKGQLIFTTHETELLNQKKQLKEKDADKEYTDKLFRADEIWLTEKHNGNTTLYSLNDFKEHNTINIRNGYMDGRYGGIPDIEELIEE